MKVAAPERQPDCFARLHIRAEGNETEHASAPVRAPSLIPGLEKCQLGYANATCRSSLLDWVAFKLAETYYHP